MKTNTVIVIHLVEVKEGINFSAMMMEYNDLKSGMNPVAIDRVDDKLVLNPLSQEDIAMVLSLFKNLSSQGVIHEKFFNEKSEVISTLIMMRDTVDAIPVEVLSLTPAEFNLTRKYVLDTMLESLIDVGIGKFMAKLESIRELMTNPSYVENKSNVIIAESVDNIKYN